MKVLGQCLAFQALGNGWLVALAMKSCGLLKSFLNHCLIFPEELKAAFALFLSAYLPSFMPHFTLK